MHVRLDNKSINLSDMKTMFIACLSMIFSWNLLSAQTETYYVGDTPLESIDAKLAEVRFFCINPLKAVPTIFVIINHGQACTNRGRMFTNRGFLETCNGLQDDRGELISFNNYITALNFMEQNGWKMTGVMDDPSDGDSSPIHAVYLFRRTEI